MKNFLSKKDILLIEERLKIIKKKYEVTYKINVSFEITDDLRSYVRVQYQLGEPCWGRNSPIIRIKNLFK